MNVGQLKQQQYRHSALPKGGFAFDIPCIIKSKSEESGKRLVEVQASSEDTDLEGDQILQKSLLGSSDYFIKNGHLDIDHFSEIGHRIGIANPSAWIIGRPVEVKDLGDGRTGVVGEIRRSADGKHDPINNKYDEFWDSLTSDPPVKWRASIYGFPTHDGLIDCKSTHCSSGATRFIVTKFRWESLAFTRHPVNDSLSGYAKVVTRKAFIEMLKGVSPLMPTSTVGLAGPSLDVEPLPIEDGHIPYGETSPPIQPFMNIPMNISDAVGQYSTHMKDECPHAGGVKSWMAFKNHFTNCCGAHPDHAELLARGLMHWLLTDKRRGHE
ncbi:MAG: hypothetical protein KGJ90_00385 [Patescibacteria group bacterium]|nr:hypothetical protein [Patescibacteria group bacterium]